MLLFKHTVRPFQEVPDILAIFTIQTPVDVFIGDQLELSTGCPLLLVHQCARLCSRITEYDISKLTCCSCQLRLLLIENEKQLKAKSEGALLFNLWTSASPVLKVSWPEIIGISSK